MLPGGSVNTCVTSPPYFGLRDYGHADQIGLEETPEQYVAKMVEVFREVRRVLRDDGTLWLNLGDSYAGSGRGGNPNGPTSTLEGGKESQEASMVKRTRDDVSPAQRENAVTNHANRQRGSQLHAGFHEEARLAGNIGRAWVPPPPGLKQKDLIGIPWLVALALRADGWYLRQDIIWHKPNPMPESVRDRCTKAHEYIFMLSKSDRYFYDNAAIAEPVAPSQVGRVRADRIGGNKGTDVHHSPGGIYTGKQAGHGRRHAGFNERYFGPRKDQTAHVGKPTQSGFAAMKSHGGNRPQLRRALELAAEKGLTDAHIDAIRAAGCTDAGKAMITQTGAGKNTEEVKRLAAEAKAALGGYYREFLTVGGVRNRRSVWTVTTKPFKGAHFATFPPDLIEPCILAGSPTGGLVLDPFGGAGTTGLVAQRYGRNAILCELNPEYAAMAEARIIADRKKNLEALL